MSTPQQLKGTVQVTHRFTTSAERVFDAWLDASCVGKWLFATKTGKVVRAEIDARVGGRFRIVDRREGLDIEHNGEYLEMDRSRRLVFTFGVPYYSKEISRVTVEINPLGTGCELTLTNELVLAEYLEGTRAGWTMILDALDGVLRLPDC